MHVGDLIGKDFLIGVGPEVTAIHAAERMAEEGVGCLVVVDQRGRLVGIVTDRDLVVRVLARGLNAATTPVSKAMTPDPVTIGVAAEIEEAARVIRETGARRLPVTDVDDRLVGVVSLDDVIAALGSELADVAGFVQAVCRGARQGGA